MEKYLTNVTLVTLELCPQTKDSKANSKEIAMSATISDAVVRWANEFQRLMAKEVSATDAMREIADSNPDLHEAFAEALQSIHVIDGEEIDAVQEANRRIAQRMRRGMSRPKAIAAVMREDPDLHVKYLRELARAGEVDR